MSTLKNFRYVARTLSGGALLAGLLLSGGCSEDDGFAADDGSGTAVNFTAGRGNARTLCGNYAANPYCDHRR